ncbi:GPI inositol deacylase [Friedmanniomyces endolithicus]|nr:GPI inositol deacylase [Friedmanniomyces endolithicus]KAK0292447.1 GPI inositol deacylase [Friedmanniomyces endolithicus]
MRRRLSDNDDANDLGNSTAATAGNADATERVERSGGIMGMKEGGSRGVARAHERKMSKEAGREQGSEGKTALWSQTLDPSAGQSALGGRVNGEGTAEMLAERHSSQRGRMRGPWACSLLTLATTACSIILLATIVRSYLTLQMDPKGCAMSFMRPAFAPFADFDTEHTRFASKYSLYLYREGGVDEDTRVKGIPVLFIPGNAGSYKQVRPIAAEAANYFQNALRIDEAAVGNGKRPLDFFTVDFNEELSAFHGQTLLDQAEYLNEAIAFILALYHNPNRSLREPGLPDPKSVIILGHSMGGVVARTMLRMPNYQQHTINTIITLSAPHARAPISFDAEMVATYNDINTFWRESYSAVSARNNPLADVTLVSVAGGGLDTMIPSEYSSLTSLVPDTHGFTVFTSAIPRVWTGMDHLAIMWCDQFRKALVRAIFDVADVRRPSQTLAQSQRIEALRKRLLTGMESVVEKATLEHEPVTFLTLEHSSTEIMSHGERLTLRSIGASGKTKAHLMPIPAQPLAEGGKFTLLTNHALNASASNGTLTALLCSVFPPSSGSTGLTFAIGMQVNSFHSAGSTRLACQNAAADISFLPASTNESVNAFDDAQPFSYLQYDLEDLHEYQFVAIVEQATEPVHGWLLAEFSSGKDSAIKISKGHHQLLLNGLRRKLPATRPMMTELKIPEVHSTLFAYKLHVARQVCGSAEDELFAPLLRQYIQEPYESKYFVNTKGGNINVHGISPYMPPPLSGKGASEGLSLQLWTDPTCDSTVKVTLSVDIVGSAGKLVMRYRTVFASFPLLVVAIVLRKQFKVYDATGVFISFSQSMDQCIRTSLPAIVTALTFLAVALSKATQGPWAQKWLGRSTTESVDFTVNDFMLGTSDPFFWFLVPLFGLISVGICIAANYTVLTLTHLFALTHGLLRPWTTTRSTSEDPRNKPATSFAPSTTYQRMITTGILLLMILTIVPYQFAYVILCLVQITTSTKALRAALDDRSDPSANFYNYTHSILVLMLWILPINMPVLVVWIHNLAVHWLTPFSTPHNLLSVLPYILLVEMLSTGAMVPRLTTRACHLTNLALFAFALYAAVYGVSHAYRLHHLANALCAWLFVVHLSHHSGGGGGGGDPVALARRLAGQYLPRRRRSSSRPSGSGSVGVGGGGGSEHGGRDVKKRP